MTRCDGTREMSHSGLVRPPAKRVEDQTSRGFASRHLRSYLPSGILYAGRAQHDYHEWDQSGARSAHICSALGLVPDGRSTTTTTGTNEDVGPPDRAAA